MTLEVDVYVFFCLSVTRSRESFLYVNHKEVIDFFFCQCCVCTDTQSCTESNHAVIEAKLAICCCTSCLFWLCFYIPATLCCAQETAFSTNSHKIIQ